MATHYHFHFPPNAPDPGVLLAINQLKELIMATNQAASDKLDALGGKLDKISGEMTGLVEAVRALKQAAEEGAVSADVMAKIDALASKAENIDTLVDDVAPNPTETPPADPVDPTEAAKSRRK